MDVAPSAVRQHGNSHQAGPARPGRSSRHPRTTRAVAAAAVTLATFSAARSTQATDTAASTRNVAAVSDATVPVTEDAEAAGLQGKGTASAPRSGGATGGRSALAIPAGWPRGIDVSSWQHPAGAEIDWNAVRAAGITFAIVKATEGKTYTNPNFANDRAQAAAAGLVVGAYHFARPVLPMATAVEQAERFLSVTGLTRASGQLAPVLDLEVHGGLTAAQLAEWTRTFLETIETRTGRAPILYTYRSFWTDTMKNTTSFSRYPLWFAIYNGASSPGSLPGGWQRWMMWQHTSSGSVPGIDGNVDLNVACCSSEALWNNADGRPSEIDRRYNSEPGLGSLLASPMRQEEPAGGGGRWRQFDNGLLFWSVTTGVHEVHGGIGAHYLALGGSNSFLRRPLSDEMDASAPGSRQSIFQGGRIYWSRPTGAHEVHGAILIDYLARGGSGSDLGLPISDEYSVPGGRESAFQYGWLRWDAASNTVTVIRP